MEEKFSTIKKILPLTGICILIYLMMKIGIEKIIDALFTIKPLYLLLSILLLIPFILIGTHKWRLILHKQGIELDFIYLLKVFLIGFFYSTLTPGRIGDYIRVPYIKERSGRPIGICISNVLIDGFLSFMGMLILAIIGSMLLIKHFPDLFLVISILSLFLVFIFFLFKKKERMLKIIYRLIPQKFREKAGSEFHFFYEGLPSIKDLIIPLLLGIITWIIFYSQAFIIARTFSIDVPYFYFITIYPIASLIGMIPITIGGLGTREATLIALLSIFGIPEEKVMVLSLTVYVIFDFFLAISGGIISLIKNR